MLKILVGCALILFLYQPDLIPQPAQKLVAILFLHEIYSSDNRTTSPFDGILLQLLVS